LSIARVFTFTLKHVARPVEFWNQNNLTSVQIKHCKTHKTNCITNDHFDLLNQ